MKKKLAPMLSACLASAFLVTSAATPTPVYAADKITVELNGNPLQTDQDPFVYDSRTFVPLRAIFEALGASIEWNPSTRTVTSTKGDVTIQLTLGSKIAYRNGAIVELDAAPMVRDDRSYVPVRFIAESFNTPVKWDDATKTVRLLPSNRTELERVLQSVVNSFYQEYMYDYHIDYVGNFTAREQGRALLGTRVGSIDYGYELDDDMTNYHGTFRHMGDFYKGINDFEMYIVYNDVYIRQQGANSWHTTSTYEKAPNIYTQFVQRAEQMSYGYELQPYAKYAVLEQTKQGHVVTFYLSGATYGEIASELGLVAIQPIGLEKVKLVYTFGPFSYLPMKFEQYTTFKGMDNFELISAETYTYSKHRERYRVTLPDGAENAPEADFKKLY